MKKVVRKFSSHAEADAADRRYYHSLSPQQRLNVLLDIIADHEEIHEAEKGLQRVYRIIELGEC